MMQRRQRQPQRRQSRETQAEKFCGLCMNAVKEIDYKNISQFKGLVSNYAKILPRKRTGTCSTHQRKLADAIKRARFMALIQYTNR